MIAHEQAERRDSFLVPAGEQKRIPPAYHLSCKEMNDGRDLAVSGLHGSAQ
jgi:hypothetical protein